jgi:hypothetical protein
MGPEMVEHLSKLLESCKIVSDNPKMLHHQHQHNRPKVQQQDSKEHPLVVIRKHKKKATSMPRLVSCFASSTPQERVSSCDPEEQQQQQQKQVSLSQEPALRRFTAPSVFTLDPDDICDNAAVDDEDDKAHELPLPTRRGGGFHTNLSLLLRSQDAALKIVSDNPKSHVNAMTRPSSSRLRSSVSTSAMDRFSSGSSEGGFRLSHNHQISRWDECLTQGTTTTSTSTIAEGNNRSCSSSSRSSSTSDSTNSLQRNAGWEPTTTRTITTTASEPHTQYPMTKTDLRFKNKNRLQTLGLSKTTIPTPSSVLRKATGAPLKQQQQQQQQQQSTGRRNSERNGNDGEEQQQPIPNATWMPLTMPQRSPDQSGNNATAGSTVVDPSSSSTGCRWSIPQRKSDSNLIYPKRRVTG